MTTAAARWGSALAALALCLLSASAVQAEGDDALLESLRRRVDTLEAERAADAEAREEELKSLRRRVEELEGEQAASTPPAPSPHHQQPAGRPTLSVGGFGNVDYRFISGFERGAGDNSDNHFALGELDLFLTSQLSERFTFLGEVVFEFESGAAARVDVERLLLRYSHADWLKVSVGRHHTPIGYWNKSFHHGTWLMTTAERPLLFEFEDEGGILPLHFLGAEFSGYLEAPAGLFSYSAIVSNGRGKTTEDIQLSDDVDGSKRAALQLAFQPFRIPDLTVGVNGLWDEIPQDRGVPGRERSLNEYIAGGHVVYAGDPLEVLVEGQWIRHVGGGHFNSYGGYAQIAWRTGHFKPYYRFDLLEVDDRDAYFARVPEAIDLRQHTLGIRIDLASFVALKLEYRRADGDRFRSDTAAAQAAFAF